LPEVSAPADDARQSDVAKPRKASGPRILLCEDEFAVRDVMRRILERGGFEVEHTSSPLHALSLVRTGSYDLLLTDVVMPEMNGKELADLACLSAPRLRVLFVSGYAGGILTAQGIGSDDRCFLRKPFRAQQLLERVHALIDFEPEAETPAAADAVP
jgi:CheY-like chemotaxis protein